MADRAGRIEHRYGDPASGRFDDDFNLYAYVGNDPLNRTDPLGKYSCGSTLSRDQCQAFTDAQNQAKTQITSTVKVLSGIQSKVAAGEKLGGAEQKVADRVSKALGKGAGTDAKVLGTLIGQASAMLAQLAGDMPAQLGASQGTAYATAEVGQLTLRPSFFGISGSLQSQTVAHESHHHGTGSPPDRPTQFGNEYISAYGSAGVLRRAELFNDPIRALQWPDAATYALGFERVGE